MSRRFISGRSSAAIYRNKINSNQSETGQSAVYLVQCSSLPPPDVTTPPPPRAPQFNTNGSLTLPVHSGQTLTYFLSTPHPQNFNNNFCYFNTSLFPVTPKHPSPSAKMYTLRDHFPLFYAQTVSNLFPGKKIS